MLSACSITFSTSDTTAIAAAVAVATTTTIAFHIACTILAWVNFDIITSFDYVAHIREFPASAIGFSVVRFCGYYNNMACNVCLSSMLYIVLIALTQNNKIPVANQKYFVYTVHSAHCRRGDNLQFIVG